MYKTLPTTAGAWLHCRQSRCVVTWLLIALSWVVLSVPTIAHAASVTEIGTGTLDRNQIDGRRWTRINFVAASTGTHTIRIAWDNDADIRFSLFNASTGERIGTTRNSPTPDQWEGDLSASEQYYLGVWAVSGSASFTATIESSIPTLLISSQPADLDVTEGHEAVFSVAASGSGVLAYQWYVNNTAIADATSSTLVLRAVSLNDDGNLYRVDVSDDNSAASSTSARLDVSEALPPSDLVDIGQGIVDSARVAGPRWVRLDFEALVTASHSIVVSWLDDTDADIRFRVYAAGGRGLGSIVNGSSPGVWVGQLLAGERYYVSLWSAGGAAAYRATLEAGEPASIVVVDNNVNGGGFQSDVTISDDGQTVYSSADVSGILKSTDGGLRFESRNKGLHSYKIASLALTPDNDQILYAGVGNKGNTGGLFRSVDGGETWGLTGDGASAKFAGNDTASIDPLPDGHPRSNGNLIVVDQGQSPASYMDDVVLAGSYKKGVRIFVQGGETEASAINTSGFVRSLARDPVLPNIAFAAIQFSNSSRNGIYRIDYSNTSSPVSTLEYPALRPEGLAVLGNGHVYAAIGTDGVVKFDGTSWQVRSAGLATDNVNRNWTAVTGYVSGDTDVVYAGVNNQSDFQYSSVWRSVNGGLNWSPLVNADANVSATVHGQTHNWWFRTGAFPQAALGRKNAIVSSIEVARGPSSSLVSDDIIYVSGRGGLWKSWNGGDSWEPAVNNLQVTANNSVAINPNDSDQVVLANTDFVVLETRTGFEASDMSRDRPVGAANMGLGVIFDVVSNELILGVGNRDANAPGRGEVFVKPATSVGAPSGSGWINTDLSSATASNNGRVRAVTYGYHDGLAATTQTILAAVEGEGVFRYHNGVWSKSTGMSLGSTERSSFVWPDNGNSGVVYLLDLSRGLFRSSDGGRSWGDIWPSMSFRNNNFYNSGYITADDNDPTTLYLSAQGHIDSPIGATFKVFRLSGADSGLFGEPGSAGITDLTRHSGFSRIQRPGPLAIGPDGSLWLTEQQDAVNSIDAALYVLQSPAIDRSFTEMTSNEYRNVAVSPSGIEVSRDGYMYIAQNGVGLVKLTLPCRLDNSC